MDFLPAVQNAVRGAFCGTFEDAGAFGDFAGGLTRAIPGPWSIPAGVAAQLAARYGYNAACPASGGPYMGGATPPPFQGGQCVGTLYNILMNYTKDGVPLQYSNTVPGAVGSPFTRINNFGNVEFVYPVGQGGEGAGNASIDGGLGGTVFVLTSMSVTVFSGPNNCGSLPDTEGPTDITYDSPGGGPPVTNSTNITFGAPRIDISGRIRVPVSFDGPLLDLGAEIDLSDGEISLNFGGDPDNSTCGLPADSDAPPPDDDSPPQEEPEGSLPIIGVVVVAEITDETAASQYFFENTPTLYLPRLGKIAFAVLVNEGDSEWSAPIDVQCLRSYIPCPAYQGATSVLGSPVDGVSLNLYPVRASIPSIFDEPN
jgi:hypothetical protein